MDGILPLWKEEGMTSHDCVFRLRKILHTRKIGHTGTLDPAVSGVLPICVGKATKLVELLTAHDKTYIGEVTLGIATTTEDREGEVIAQQAVAPDVTVAQIDTAMAQFIGTIQQVPPMYSAVKVNGRKLYEYARAGQDVERPQREVHIRAFERLSEPEYDAENLTLRWSFRVVCSKGTYVRTLAVDLGRALGYPAHMSALTRVASGGYNQADCLTLDEVAEAMAAEQLRLLPIATALTDFAAVRLTEVQWQAVRNGAVLDRVQLPAPTLPVVCYYADAPVAIYDAHPTKSDALKPIKMLL